MEEFEIFEIHAAETYVQVVFQGTPAIHVIEKFGKELPLDVLVLAHVIRHACNRAGHFFLASFSARSKHAVPTSDGCLSGSSKRNFDTFLISVTGREKRMARTSLSAIFGSGKSNIRPSTLWSLLHFASGIATLRSRNPFRSTVSVFSKRSSLAFNGRFFILLVKLVNFFRPSRIFDEHVDRLQKKLRYLSSLSSEEAGKGLSTKRSRRQRFV